MEAGPSLGAQIREGVSPWGSADPCGLHRKKHLWPQVPQAKAPSASDRHPLPSACLWSPRGFVGSLSGARWWSEGVRQDPECIFSM